MQKPVLVIMAAGMGSRFGGVKQLASVDKYDNKLIDFSVFDAIRAGFEEVIFIIKHEIEDDFYKAVSGRLEKHIKTRFAFQELSMVPKGAAILPERIKPLGTTHALLCAADIINGRPFAAINADDCYGPEAFQHAYSFLSAQHDANSHALIGYKIENTITKHGSVSRGVCVVDENNMLSDIQERTKIIKTDDCAAFTEDGISFTPIARGTTVSMNFFAFNNGMMDYLKAKFEADLIPGLAANPMKYEALLPSDVCTSLTHGHNVKVISTHDKWFGVTYQADTPMVLEGIASLKREGVYPDKLWS